MQYEIHPMRGINNMRFGQTSGEIHTLLGSPEQVSDLQNGDVREAYRSHSIFVEYEQGGAVAFELAPETGAVLSGKNIFTLSYLEVLNMLKAQDSEIEKHIVYRGDDVESLTSRKLGISVWLPDGVNGKPGSVVVFSAGYYD